MKERILFNDTICSYPVRGQTSVTKKNPPITWFKRIKHLFQMQPKNKEQLIGLLREANVRAIIDNDTLAMIEGVILLSQMKVRDIMLPKKQMICVDENVSLQAVLDIVSESGHSRFPVMNETKDEVIGILHAKDLLPIQAALNIEFDVGDMIRQATYVPESKRLDILLREFRENRNHMAIVVDEYGVVAGFVTLEDIIEQVIGDIEDEFDIDEEAYIKSHDKAHYIIKAHMPIEEFNEELHAKFSDEFYDTIGGIVMTNFGYLPKRGEVITIEHFEFKIINADARRIKLIECIDLRPQSSI